jgi:DNA-binding transcriptional ArsR family regulator
MMDTFSAIVEPNRRLLLEAVRHQPCTVNMLVNVAGLSQPAVSKHLKILKTANLVTVRPDGQKRWYELNAQPLMEVDRFLEPYRQFLSNKLDNLERHLDEMDQ